MDEPTEYFQEMQHDIRLHLREMKHLNSNIEGIKDSAKSATTALWWIALSPLIMSIMIIIWFMY